ncbi:MAG TPA: hypothetical protein VLT33_30775 [Labilithrix sp.]|nr:hypothetical protein [Labilithrix sp.]
MPRVLLAVPVLSILSLFSVACGAPSPPVAPPAVASAPVPDPQLTSVALEKVEARPIVFEDLFLEADAFPTMNQILSPKECRPGYVIFTCLGGPGGKESALSEWGDPDGRRALWRISDLRWVFDDVAGAQAFEKKLVAHFEQKHFRVTTCDDLMGEECSRIEIGPERENDRMPHTEIGFIFRIGTVVAEVEGAEGPRVGATRIDDSMVVPYGHRAAARIRAATARR